MEKILYQVCVSLTEMLNSCLNSGVKVDSLIGLLKEQNKQGKTPQNQPAACILKGVLPVLVLWGLLRGKQPMSNALFSFPAWALKGRSHGEQAVWIWFMGKREKDFHGRILHCSAVRDAIEDTTRRLETAFHGLCWAQAQLWQVTGREILVWDIVDFRV